MKKITVDKKILIESVAKMAADKAVVRSFLKGKTPVETLRQKGITLAKPI